MKRLALIITLVVISLSILTSCSILDAEKSTTAITGTESQESEIVTEETESTDKENASESKTDVTGETAEETLSETVVSGNETEENTSVQTNDETTNEDETGNETESDTEVTVSEAKVNFFMINDNHGVFVSDDGESGVERIANILYKSDASSGDSIRIANGDIFQGTYVSSTLRGKPMLEALNEMDFDCFVIGNHEFDWGLDVIYQYADGDLSNGEANFPFLGANIYEKSTGKRVEWIEPYAIVENNGVKVGIIGVIGPGLESSILTSKVKDYEFVEYEELVSNYASELRSKGCQIVVLAAHEYDEDSNISTSKLNGDSRIDAIFCAHTHQKIDETVSRSDGYNIPVVQNYGNGGTASRLELTYDNGNITAKVYQYNVKNFEVDSSMTENVINKYSDVINVSKEKIGYTNYKLSKDELGHIATDALVDTYNADIGIINKGGVRSTINSGNITTADVFSVFPFENEVILVQMKGSLIKSLYNKSGSYLYFNTDFNVNSLNLNTTYTVAVIDYVYEYTYYQYAFGNTTPEYTYDCMRDVLIDLFKAEYSLNYSMSFQYIAA